MISFSKLGQGKIVYYGILDDYSDFKATPGYPIFWTSLIDYLVESEDVKDYNKKIEERPLIDIQGIHNEEGKQMAVNLLNEKERIVMQYIVNNEGCLQSNLQKEVGYSKSNLTKIVKKLEFRALIKRHKIGKINKLYLGAKVKAD